MPLPLSPTPTLRSKSPSVTLNTDLNFARFNALDDAPITNVKLYPNFAEVSRTLTADLPAGRTKITVTNIPGVALHDSVKVEGTGAATIHDVIASNQPPLVCGPAEKMVAPSASLLPALKVENDLLERQAQRAHHQKSTIRKYMDAFDPSLSSVAQISDALAFYRTTVADLDAELIEVETKQEQLRLEIRRIECDVLKEVSAQTEAALVAQEDQEEIKVLSSKRWKIIIIVWTDTPATCRFVLKYDVQAAATWQTSYDIRVGDPTGTVTLDYKARISQRTGESWVNVPLTLETLNPIYDLDLPTLPTWRIDTHPVKRRHAPSSHRPKKRRTRNVNRFLDLEAEIEEDEDQQEAGVQLYESNIAYRTGLVDSTSNILSDAASFIIPGCTTIPSDGIAHHVLIASIRLSGHITHLLVPKVRAYSYLETALVNTSQYLLLPGPVNVYINGMYIAQTKLGAVGGATPGPIRPMERIRVGLGVDRSVKATYAYSGGNGVGERDAFRSTAISQTARALGWMLGRGPQLAAPSLSADGESKDRQRTVQQARRIRVDVSHLHINSKTLSEIDNERSSPRRTLKLVDQVPVSNDPRVVIRVVSPPLGIVKGLWEGSNEGCPITNPVGAASYPPTTAQQIGPYLRIREGVWVRWGDAGAYPEMDDWFFDSTDVAKGSVEQVGSPSLPPDLSQCMGPCDAGKMTFLFTLSSYQDSHVEVDLRFEVDIAAGVNVKGMWDAKVEGSEEDDDEFE